MDIQAARHSVSVSGVIPDDHGRVLLIRRRDNQHWEPPGGVLELGEAIHDGLRREIREETGLDIEPDALTGVYKNMPRGIIARVFRCKITGGHLTPNDEVTAFHWADDAEIRMIRDNIVIHKKGEMPGMVRASFGMYNTPEEVDVLVKALGDIAAGRYRGEYTQNITSGEYHAKGWDPDLTPYFKL